MHQRDVVSDLVVIIFDFLSYLCRAAPAVQPNVQPTTKLSFMMMKKLPIMAFAAAAVIGCGIDKPADTTDDGINPPPTAR